MDTHGDDGKDRAVEDRSTRQEHRRDRYHPDDHRALGGDAKSWRRSADWGDGAALTWRKSAPSPASAESNSPQAGPSPGASPPGPRHTRRSYKSKRTKRSAS